MTHAIQTYLGRPVHLADGSGVIVGVCVDTKTLVIEYADGRKTHLTGSEVRQALALGSPANEESLDQASATQFPSHPTDDDVVTGSPSPGASSSCSWKATP